MTIDRDILARCLDDVHAIKESIKTEFIMHDNPGLPTIHEKLRTVVRLLEDIEDELDGLIVAG